MTRRAPPTPLRLHNGPLPPRGKPRHTLPSLPRPAHHSVSSTQRGMAGPVPRARMANTDLPALVIAEGAVCQPGSGASLEGAQSGSSSPASSASASAQQRSNSNSSHSDEKKKKEREGRFVRGPWDHAGAIRVPFDVCAVLAPPMPVAVNVRGGEEGKWREGGF